jgi:transcription termination factor NusB
MLWYSQEIPAKVSINEAIDLAKYYWDLQSKNIVNGILNTAFENIGDFTWNQFISSQKYHFFSDK